eukprot:TRINITY_DN4249_c0_g1_i1.p1 TRINITY_DN4249_c0_g1~~TRINITY_DN4249_c0_g1_i1.p1  ORF type:complete len:146 (+),score=30.36 TRINITY_DN4249_c0_g1_i1:34-471(+)
MLTSLFRQSATRISRQQTRTVGARFAAKSTRKMSTAAAEMESSESGAASSVLQKLKGVKLVGRSIYLDMQATTPVDPRVLDAMLPFYTEQFGNPHSRTHPYGWENELAVETAREVRPGEIGDFPFSALSAARGEVLQAHVCELER